MLQHTIPSCEAEPSEYIKVSLDYVHLVGRCAFKVQHFSTDSDSVLHTARRLDGDNRKNQVVHRS